ncbi:MAG: trypsin-like peptidase domain-containing protein [Deltaproteobacteria bacterium]|nr:trypsin-like peptidase domain-containing protein [Deltaproteobacteria bacterium]
MTTIGRALFGAVLLTASLAANCGAAEFSALADTIEKVKPSVVAVGTFQKTRRPPAVFRGTGFVIGKGLHVVTNAHVLPEKVDADKREFVAIFTGKGQTPDIREATKVAEDLDYDLAVLRISGEPLTALKLGDSTRVREGEYYALTGFPIGMVLGLHAVTHRAMIAAITPIAIPQLSAQQIDKKVLARLIAPYNIFQLDATAYPGNSGSPLYDIQSGQVIGIVNKVFVQSSRESAIEKPSGISYAIQISHLKDLLKKAGVE